MADGVQYHHHETKVEEPCDAPTAVENTDRGVFNFMGMKEEEKCKEEVIPAKFEQKVEACDEKKEDEKKHEGLLEKLHLRTDKEKCEDEQKVVVCEENKEDKKKHEGLLEKLHRSNSSSSSSSDEEEVDENGEKKKKKKALKEMIKEKIEKKEEEKKCEDTSIPIEKCDDIIPKHESEEKKGLLDEIKEKLPGSKKEEVAPPQPPAECYAAPPPEVEKKEKKGFMDKIKDKIPGFNSKSDEEKEKEKEKENKKEGACH